ncbi:hypothetical protein NOR_01753 [Metarhizium rileyi]|uniref:HNH nuclease domain-containing protein n=1 Tax=Metarhizium rileyi (strain RCEF 4871) TaxID=1649241 RepID=A0A167HZM0_METRR|nr:hypothetical protein NOR_01753 [Metarhizium rileyi RCEF 4871]
MSNAAITPQLRALGWNVHILCGPESDRFAGIFQPPGIDSLTYRDIVDELRLAFDIPTESGAGGGERATPWQDIAFGYEESVGGHLQPLEEGASPTSITSLRMISGQYLDRFVSIPPGDKSSDPRRPAIVCLHAVRHTTCGISHIEPVSVHLREGCARHIPYPFLRRDERYLPPGKASGDPRFAQLPYPKTIRSTRSPHSPSKRSASGSASPPKDPRSYSDAGVGEDVVNMVVPATENISLEQARQTMAAFRTSCLAGSTTCAVSGKGRSWYKNPNIGPGIQACHIVPQQHYNVYPVPESFGKDQYCSRRLREAWNRTWSAENSLALFSHFHDFFDNRLFSIHPVTLRIRVFMPYDVLLEHHGSIAQLSPMVDRRALRHHYDMCCFENIAAKMILSDISVSEMTSRSAISGPISPLQSGCQTPIMPHVTNTASRSLKDAPGDPQKRARPGSDKPVSDTNHCLCEMELSTGDGSSSSSSLEYNPSPLDRMKLEKNGQLDLDQTGEYTQRKRRRISGEDSNAVWIHGGDDQESRPFWDGHITPENHDLFLSGVNSELHKTMASDGGGFS